MTAVYITFDNMPPRILTDALRARGVLLANCDSESELYTGRLEDSADDVDAWFAELPWSGDDTAALVAIGRDAMVTTVVVDGELASSTRADDEGVEVDTFEEVAA